MSARYHDKVVANAVIGTNDAEAWAIGKRDNVDVTTTDPVYKNNSKYYASQAGAAATNAANSASTASSKATAAGTSATNAANSASAASKSASGASTSATNASASATAAKTSETNAANSAKAAAASQTAAKTSETNADSSASTAASKATAAAASQTAAKTSETNAASSASTASTKATAASTSATNAKASETKAKAAENAAADILEQCKTVVAGVTGALIPRGTIAFASLPAASDAETGWLYNISDDFTTTASFEEGAGIKVAAGSNVYMTANSKWDVLVGAAVVGVKGNAEITYRTGQVNLTPANLGAMTSTDPTGTGAFSLNREADTVVGNYSFAEGYSGKASGTASHSEGYDTEAGGHSSHAEGYRTAAVGDYSHAEGRSTNASGEGSHTEGYMTTASGKYSSASGCFTDAPYKCQFAVGYGNNPQPDSIFEVGNALTENGTPANDSNIAPTTMQNAFRVTQAGQAIAQTGLGIGGTNMTEAQLKNLLGSSGESRFDGIARFIGSPATDNSQVYNEANVVAVVMNPSADNKIRSGYGFHNAGINGLFLYLDIDGYLKMLDTATCVVPKGDRVYAIAWKESETQKLRPQLLVDGTTWIEIPTYNEISYLLEQSPYTVVFDFDTNGYMDSSKYRYLLYKAKDGNNFAGIGCNYSGDIIFKAGTGSVPYVFRMKSTGGFECINTKAGTIGHYREDQIIATKDYYIVAQTGSIYLRGNGVSAQSADGNSRAPMYASSFSQESSKKYKKNIVNMTEEDANKLLQLRPVQYDYINELNGTGCYGLIAEEVDEIMPYPVVYDADGNPDGIDYAKFASYLIKKVQMQEAEIDRLKKHTADLEERLKKLEDLIINK